MSIGKEFKQIERACDTCGNLYYTARPWGRYDSFECRQIGWARNRLKKGIKTKIGNRIKTKHR